MQLEMLGGKRFQGFRRHDGAQVGTADTDVDDVGDGFAGIAFPPPATDLVAEHAHMRQDFVNAGHDILALGQDRTIAAIAQRDMQHGSILGEVDFFAVEHARGVL